MKPTFKIPSVVILPAIVGALGLLAAAAYGGFFLYEMVSSSVGRGGGKYALELPATSPANTKDAPWCAQKTSKWLGCF